MTRNEKLLALVAAFFAAVLLANQYVRVQEAKEARERLDRAFTPEPCDGQCLRRMAPPQPRPFNVTCPHCRRAITVKPPKTGDIGETAAE